MKFIRKWFGLEDNKEEKSEEKSIDDLKDIKFGVEQLNNGICKLLFIYNGEKYHIKIRHIGIEVSTNTDCEDKFVDNIVSDFMCAGDYHWDLIHKYRTIRTPYSLADNLSQNNWYDDNEIKEIIDEINKYRPKYIKFTKEEKIRKQKEKEERVKGFEHKQYIF